MVKKVIPVLLLKRMLELNNRTGISFLFIARRVMNLAVPISLPIPSVHFLLVYFTQNILLILSNTFFKNDIMLIIFIP